MRGRTAKVQLASRGAAPEGWVPIGGFGLGVKGRGLDTTAYPLARLDRKDERALAVSYVIA
jgi:hypothetical protein